MKLRYNFTLNDFDHVNLELLCSTFCCSKSELIRWFISNACKSSAVMRQFCKDTGRDFAEFQNGYYTKFDIKEKNESRPVAARRSSFDYCCTNNTLDDDDCQITDEEVREALAFL